MRRKSAIYADMEAACESAKAMGFPAFPRGVSASTPVNATPFLMDIAEFERLADDCWRRELLQRFSEMLIDLRSLGAQPIAALIGGSFLDFARSPRDLDCVVFYEDGEGAGGALLASQNRWRDRRIDVRFIPYDRDPIILLKVSAYFGALYAATKQPSEPTKAALLLDLYREEAP